MIFQYVSAYSINPSNNEKIFDYSMCFAIRRTLFSGTLFSGEPFFPGPSFPGPFFPAFIHIYAILPPLKTVHFLQRLWWLLFFLIINKPIYTRFFIKIHPEKILNGKLCVHIFTQIRFFVNNISLLPFIRIITSTTALKYLSDFISFLCTTWIVVILAAHPSIGNIGNMIHFLWIILRILSNVLAN